MAKIRRKSGTAKENGGENEFSPPFLTFGSGGEVAGMEIKGYLCGMELEKLKRRIVTLENVVLIQSIALLVIAIRLIFLSL